MSRYSVFTNVGENQWLTEHAVRHAHHATKLLWWHSWQHLPLRACPLDKWLLKHHQNVPTSGQRQSLAARGSGRLVNLPVKHKFANAKVSARSG